VVFGKVIRGYDVIEKITQVSVDEKSRPAVPVVITNCGELELRKKPATEAPAASTLKPTMLFPFANYFRPRGEIL
jgi:hypothetical protein